MSNDIMNLAQLKSGSKRDIEIKPSVSLQNRLKHFNKQLKLIMKEFLKNASNEELHLVPTNSALQRYACKSYTGERMVKFITFNDVNESVGHRIFSLTNVMKRNPMSFSS
ncbi:hypothetical protein T01_13025 [Trichinella spiralis]|uniref:Uncharacterized protein n=1 Tax=Trichinella spiralis TaxID=6334 RepID=A0A0V1BK91_TRISP|nr:hypothetical protein T01_13025 [Trichinella spiralis]